MEEFNLTPNAAIYNYIINLFASSGNTEPALRYLQVMKDKNLAIDLHAFSVLVEAVARQGLPRLALDLIEAFEKETVRKVEPSVWMTVLASASNALWVSSCITSTSYCS